MKFVALTDLRNEKICYVNPYSVVTVGVRDGKTTLSFIGIQNTLEVVESQQDVIDLFDSYEG